MPVYKALILNKQININYDQNQKLELEEAIKEINFKLKNYDQSGKISDTKLLSFLAIKLQSEILTHDKNTQKNITLEKKINDSNIKNINLNEKIYELNEQNKLLKEENGLINEELVKLKKQIEIIINLVKKTYEE